MIKLEIFSKIFRLSLLILSLTLQIFPQTNSFPSCNSKNSSRYPNELSSFKFYETSKWNSLDFLVSTMGDVRRVMGEPTTAVDTAQMGIVYPGDKKALQPVFIYHGDQWDTHFYFGKYCYYTTDLPEKFSDKLCEIVLHPKKDIPADDIVFSKVFAKKTKQLPDGSWDEYKDNFGLTYIVNYKDNEKEKSRYLGNITYSVSNKELEKVKQK